MGNLDRIGGFDANEVEPASDFSTPLPAGDYLGMAIDSGFKSTQRGDGEYLELALEIIDGEHKGRRLWDRLNLINPNDKAVTIARATMSSICRAVGVMQVKDSAELHGKPMKIKVVLEERNDKPGTFRNIVKGYSPANGSPSNVGAAPASSNGGSKPPWKK
jgi:hypothetical protein